MRGVAVSPCDAANVRRRALTWGSLPANSCSPSSASCSRPWPSRDIPSSGLGKQIIGTLVDELAELGYVRREPDPTDRRAKLIVPTARGLDQMARSDAIMAAIEQRHADALGQHAYAEFKQAFQQVSQNQRDR